MKIKKYRRLKKTIWEKYYECRNKSKQDNLDRLYIKTIRNAIKWVVYSDGRPRETWNSTKLYL